MSLRAELDLILPGYAAVSDNDLNRQLLPPQLQKILRSARFKKDTRSASRLLFERLGVNTATDSDLPVASLRRANQLSLCADPCYLVADRSLLRIGNDALQLDESEAQALIATLQPVFAEYGMRLEADTPDRWSLLIDDSPDVSFHALPDIVSQPLDDQMPAGQDSSRWLQLLNVCQMALFEHPVNQQREQAGQLPVNGVWFWGQGELVQSTQRVSQLAGKHPLATALADQTGIPHQSNFQISNYSSGRHIAIAPPLDPEADLDEQLASVDVYLADIVSRLRQMKLRRLNLYITGAGVYRLNPLRAWLSR